MEYLANGFKITNLALHGNLARLKNAFIQVIASSVKQAPFLIQ